VPDSTGCQGRSQSGGPGKKTTFADCNSSQSRALALLLVNLNVPLRYGPIHYTGRASKFTGNADSSKVAMNLSIFLSLSAPAGRSRLWRSAPETTSRLNRFILFVTALLVTSGLAISGARAQSTSFAQERTSSVQIVYPATSGQPSPSLVVTLQDALDRASKNDSQFLAAVLDARSAHEDHLQARNAFLPTVTNSTQYLGTQGNGKTPEGRFVTNDGVHVYREWVTLHEDISPVNYMLTGDRRAAALEAIAKAKSEIAGRGLVVTVTKYYYSLAASQRKYAFARQSLDQARHFLDTTQAGERGGQIAHADVLRADIRFQQQRQAFDEANLAMENSRLDLAVMLFPVLNENFTVVDDMDLAQALPPFPELQGMAERENPDLRVASASAQAADQDVSAAKGSFLPSLTIDADYGIEANDFALHAIAKAHPGEGYLPTLGYFVTASLNVPIWDWGTLRSKLHQAEYKQQKSHAELGETQRQALRDLYSLYNEALVAASSVAMSRRTADLTAESLRLTSLRYEAGESSALEVVDAQNSLTVAQCTYVDAQVRYRVAVATLQTLTGSF